MSFDFTSNPLGGSGGIELGKGINFGKGFGKKSPVPDPLKDVEYTGNNETDSKKELDAIAEGWRQRKDMEADRFEETTDSEYWFAVCFKTRGDKEAFLNQIKQLQWLGDKYLNGYDFSEALGLPVERPEKG